MTVVALRDVAPRLALARDQWVHAVWLEGRRQRKLAGLILDAERLVAHRDLQLVRSYSTGSSTYIRVRQDKLKVAVAKLEQLRAWKAKVPS